MPVAAAAANALKKRNKSSKKKEEATFPTPARYGWGQGRRVQASFQSFNIIILLFPFSGRSSDKPQDGPGTENIYDVWYDIHSLDMQSVL